MFTGVIGGIGEYFNVDPTLFRLIWVLMVITTGIIPGIFTYIIAVMIVPNPS